MPRMKGETVSIRIHTTNKAVIDYVIAQHRAKTGLGLSNDEVLWEALKERYPEAVRAALDAGATPPTDKRRKDDTDASE